jgi:hypothetical protein
MEDIRLTNVSLFMEQENAIDKRSRHGFHFHNMRNLTMEGCEVQWDEQHPDTTWQKAFNFEQIENLYLNKIKGKPAPGQTEAIQYSQIKGDWVK